LASLALGFVALGCSNPPQPEIETWQQPVTHWEEVWRDDFDGPSGSAPNPTYWNVEVRETGHNGELDYNTDERSNSVLDGGGKLVIQALKEHYVDASGAASSQPYTSARLNTQGKVEYAYGKFEARIKLPQGGRGVWPAFWMLGNDIDVVGWPECGEVDVLEMGGSDPFRVDGTLHGPGYSGGNSYHSAYDLPSGNFGDDFHVFTFEWTELGVRWLVDGQEYYVKTVRGMEQSGHRWVYDHPFFLIMNLAIGGIYDGDPTPSTPFPQQMVIDYVSIAQPKTE
ncbi:MAG TPA: glycoside hydrolase family 16 protein, partial [Polyangiaceae bacterium]